jgi:hypothetical protein
MIDMSLKVWPIWPVSAEEPKMSQATQGPAFYRAWVAGAHPPGNPRNRLLLVADEI